MEPFSPLLIASVPFLASMGFTPGPNNIMVASSGVNFGFKATIPHMLGISVGYPLMMVLVGLGLARVFAAVPLLHTVLKYSCIAYLLYLSWRIATSSAEMNEARRTARPLGFFQAAAFQWINGKGWVVAISAVTTYTVADSAFMLQVLALSAIATVVTIGSVTCWTAFGALLRKYLHTPRRRRHFNHAMAAILVASIVPVFWD